MPKCKICGANSQGWCRCGSAYNKAMKKFNKRKAIKGVITEQEKVKLEGRY